MLHSDSSVIKKNVPLYEKAYQQIKKEILTGRIKSGSKIIESSLVERFQISRTPLREALRQLQKEGLLVDNNLGFKVIELSSKDYKEVYETRLVLEKEIVKLVVEKITDRQIAQVERILEEAEMSLDKADYLEIMEINARFHKTIVDFCENKTLAQFWSRTLPLLSLYRANVLKDSGNILDAHNEHKDIVAVLKEKNAEKAVEEVELHIIKSLNRDKKSWM